MTATIAGRVVWYLAACEECGPFAEAGPLPMPFAVEQDRDSWAGVHAAATGHGVVMWKEVR